MTNLIKNLGENFTKNPTVAFMAITLAACYYLYNDLSNFITEQQKTLSTQVETQTKTIDILNNILQRISEIELKIYNDKDK